jgi:hypothetical protein
MRMNLMGALGGAGVRLGLAAAGVSRRKAFMLTMTLVALALQARDESDDEFRGRPAAACVTRCCWPSGAVADVMPGSHHLEIQAQRLIW